MAILCWAAKNSLRGTSIQGGDFRAEINFFNFLQMGEILVILFQLPHAPSTLANLYRMRRLRQQSATAYACNLLPYAPSTVAKHTILHSFATACAVYASKLLPYAPSTLAICYRMRRIRQQIATICAVSASNLQPHTLAKCYRMRRRHYYVFSEYTLLFQLPHAPSTLAKCFRMRCIR